MTGAPTGAAATDRAVLAGLARLLPRHRLGHLFVQPATLPRCARSSCSGAGLSRDGHPLRRGTTALILRLATENPPGATGGSRENLPL